MKKRSRIWIYSIFVIGFLLILSNSCKKVSDNTNPADIDGNVYHTVTIGTQVWMVENLKVTHYRNGDAIPNITDDVAWGNLTTGAFCDYNNTPANSTTYSKLYNFYTVSDSRNICPTGWHVPTNVEFAALTTYLGGESIAGGKLKEAGTVHWQSPNTGATNESGFTALPGGNREENGSYDSMTDSGNWWSSIESSSINAYFSWMDNVDANLYSGTFTKKAGFSVRCVKD